MAALIFRKRRLLDHPLFAISEAPRPHAGSTEVTRAGASDAASGGALRQLQVEIERMGKNLYRLTLAQESMSEELKSALQQLRAAPRGEIDERRKMAEEFLPLIDALHRLARALANQGNQALAEGARIVAAKGDAYLAGLGVQVITSMGQPFDPHIHQALEARPAGPDLQGRVIEEIVRGYRMGNRVLRTAQVVVGKEG